MNKLLTIFIMVILATSCSQETQSGEANAKEENGPQYFGAKITEEGAIPSTELMAKMEGKDSLNIKVSGKIEDVCQKKGCWMNVAIDNDNSVFVKFKDYAFFVPKDATGKDVIIEGIAFIDTTSIEELRHYAEDAGEPSSVIDAITEPEIGYNFMASGIIVK